MKKEIIYFSQFSMLEPNSVELLEGLKGRVNMNEIKDIQEHKVLNFWDKIKIIGVWDWKKKYNIKEEILDGHHWELKLRDRNGNAKHVEGYMSYPRKYKELIKELNYLFDTNLDF